MEKNILIIKTGCAYPSMVRRWGDFEDWIITGMGVDPTRVQVVDVQHGEALPEPEAAAAVVVTGSHAMITEQRRWSERSAAWLRRAVEASIPTLGICYGHQLLAYAFGGQVADNPGGLNYGTVELCLSQAGRDDPLLGHLHHPVNVQVCHMQSVVRLPQEARLLGWDDGNPYQAFAIGECAWGVQFHPEFSAEVLRTYVRHDRRKLKGEGKDPQAILDGVTETPVGGEILKRFAGLYFA